MRKTVIWVANEAGHPYEKALDRVPDAEIKPLTIGNINPLLVDRLCWHLAHGIASYVHQEDYLILAGKPIINMLVGVLWFTRFEKMKLLQWDAKNRVYEIRIIEKENYERLLEREMMRV